MAVYPVVMSDSNDNIPFSQRNGYVPFIQQLDLEKIPQEFKEKVKALLDAIIKKNKNFSYVIDPEYIYVVKNLYINFYKGDYRYFDNSKKFVNYFIFDFIDRSSFFEIFDFLEQIIIDFYNIRKDNGVELYLKSLFKKYRLAYTIYNGKIVPIANDTEGKTYIGALNMTEKTGTNGAHSHLIKAGEQINHQKWAESVRESISAVEAVCRQIAGENASLGAALSKIAKQYHLHPAFKKALSELYGYTSDENGIRHSLLDNPQAKVDQTDALFMLGACASFVSYLLARTLLKNS